MPTKTKDQVLAEADKVAQIDLEIAELIAQRDIAVASTLQIYAPQIDAKRKSRTSLQTKVRTFLKSHAKKIFPGKGSGEHKTSISITSWKKNPDKIAPLDKKLDDEQLAAHLLKHEGSHAVRAANLPDKEWLKKQTDEKLEFLGWKKTSDHTLKITPLAKSEATKKATT